VKCNLYFPVSPVIPMKLHNDISICQGLLLLSYVINILPKVWAVRLCKHC
jgi:hypothetical protein